MSRQRAFAKRNSIPCDRDPSCNDALHAKSRSQRRFTNGSVTQLEAIPQQHFYNNAPSDWLQTKRLSENVRAARELINAVGSAYQQPESTNDQRLLVATAASCTEPVPMPLYDVRPVDTPNANIDANLLCHGSVVAAWLVSCALVAVLQATEIAVCESNASELIPARLRTRPVAMPDGSIQAFHTSGGPVYSTRSSDCGRTWSPLRVQLRLPKDRIGGGRSVDTVGETHPILTQARETGQPTATRSIDLTPSTGCSRRIAVDQLGNASNGPNLLFLGRMGGYNCPTPRSLQSANPPSGLLPHSRHSRSQSCAIRH